ncbi:hypothetical protein [Sphingomonas sp.]|uniref:hypothetical protein n=1 Tax=Sphingomonas sp. TaxID=28214 RepID=UPI001EBF9A81|nr:hypothetical protein [Sphingomonas sp.]MBX3593656.1 hypothetical protein [Sphingomonas sp.]
MIARSLAGALFVVTCAGCSPAARHVAGPFYLIERPESRELALYRCPDGPPGCAIDELPVLNVLAAGGNDHFVAVQSDRGYYYLRRIAQERSGWGNNPEKIVGPLSEADFTASRRRLGLPDLDIRP